MVKSVLFRILLTASLLIFLLLGQGFFRLIQTVFWRNRDVICIAPAEYYFRIGSLLLFTCFLGIWGLVSLITRKKHHRRNTIRGKYILGLISFLAIVFPILTINKCTIFTPDSIICQKGIPLLQSIHTYDKIREVRVSQFNGMYYDRIIYAFITTDGKKIDLTTDNYNIRYIGEIKEKINDSVPHIVTSDAYTGLSSDLKKIVRWKVEGH